MRAERSGKLWLQKFRYIRVGPKNGEKKAKLMYPLIYLALPVIMIVLALGYSRWFRKNNYGPGLMAGTYNLEQGETVLQAFAGHLAPVGGSAGHLAMLAVGSASRLRIKQRPCGVALTNHGRLIVAPMDTGVWDIDLGSDEILSFSKDRPVRIAFGPAPVTMTLYTSVASPILVTFSAEGTERSTVLPGDCQEPLTNWAREQGFELSVC